jgi:hypothetical protein
VVPKSRRHSDVVPKMRINVPSDDAPPQTLSEWPPSNMKPSRERLEEWLKLFISVERWDQVEECERYLFHSIGNPQDLHDALVRSGDRWWRNRDDLGRARLRYREALQADPHSERAAARMRAVGHELGRRRVQPFRPA